MGWACAQTYGNQEAKAVLNLRRQNYTAFCPQVLRPVLGRQGEHVRRPLFPCYVFVLIEPDQPWRSIDSTYGVIRLLTDRHREQPRPLYVADSLIEFWINDRYEEPLPVNALVRVRQKDSPFFETIGTVVEMSASQRVSVLMTLFNRDVVVEFSAAALEEV